MEEYDIRFYRRIHQIGRESWQRLAADAGPFLQYGFLSALEDSGSVGPGTGWMPEHLTISRHDEEYPLLVLPMYRKSHSWGEYVFDWGWADAWARFGLSYYPKLVTAVPFTPSTGPRILGAADVTQAAMPALLRAIRERLGEMEGSSWHILFPREQDALQLQQCGLLRRQGSQFHWFNRGYQDFEGFLSTFSSRRRKNVRKERRSVQQAGIRCHRFTGEQIDEALWDRFYAFYQRTYAERGQRGYLSRRFFTLLGQRMSQSVLLVMAELDGVWVAGALYLKDTKRLFGRYWGADVDIPGLHFEACYYQGIEYCIEQGMECFDAGAQGEHKLARGFEPVRTDSLHWIEDERFRDAVARFCLEEARHVDGYMEAARQALPYRKDNTDH